MTTSTFSIPSFQFIALSHEIDRLNRRSKKLGLSPLTLNITGTSNVLINDTIRPKYNLEFTNFTIDGSVPVVEGYAFIAAKDLVDGMVIIKRAAGSEEIDLPESVYEDSNHCDHCQTNRQRVYTYILQNVETGEFIQVGKACLKDFLKTDVSKVVSMFSSWNRVISELSDPDSDWYDLGGAPSSASKFGFMEILRLAFASSRTFGYIKSSEPDSTKEEVYRNLLGLTDKGMELKVSDADLTNSELCADWLAGLEDSNDFIRNNKQLQEVGLVSLRYLGFICGLIPGFQKAQQEALANAGNNSEYVGTIKKRQVMNLRLIGIKTMDSFYGATFLHTFEDDKGNVVVWFASQDSEMEVGETYKVKATPKTHKEFRGVKQTTVSRVART